MGKVTRSFTEEEEKEMMANEFAMHLLVPTDAVKKLAKQHGGLEKLISSMYRVQTFADMFMVSPEVFYFKVKEMKELEDEVNLYIEGEHDFNKQKKLTLKEKIKKLFRRQ